MESVKKNIAELLLRHNCVIIPGFGAFVGNYASARVDAKRNLIYPPTKEVIFNKNIIRNDGLLISKIQEDTGLSYQEAEALIKEFVQTLLFELKEKRRVELQQVGILFYNQENNIQFEQDRLSNLLLASFGLSSIRFVNYENASLVIEKEQEMSPKPANLKRNVIEEKERLEENEIKEKELQRTVLSEKKTNLTNKEKETKLIQKDRNSDEKIKEVTFETSGDEVTVDERKDALVVSLNNSSEEKKNQKEVTRFIPWGRIAAAVIMVPIAFYSYWIPFQTNVFHTGYVTPHDFNPLSESKKMVYAPRAKTFSIEVGEFPTSTLKETLDNLPDDVAYYSFQLDENLYIPVDLRKTEADTFEEAASSETHLPSGSYHVIVGCFGNVSNADKMVSELRDNGYPNAHVVDINKGLHRVSSGPIANEDEAKNQKEKLLNSGYKGWLLKK